MARTGKGGQGDEGNERVQPQRLNHHAPVAGPVKQLKRAVQTKKNRERWAAAEKRKKTASGDYKAR